MFQKTLGIVLHTIRYNDSSDIVDMYTGLHGRVSYLVKLPRTKKAAVKSVLFQPLSLVEFEVDYRPTVSLQRIVEAKFYYPFRSLPFDPCKSAIGLFIAEFLYRALREESENRPLFAYLLYSIQWLDTIECGFANFHLVFLMRLSKFLGLYPNVEGYRPGDYFDLQNACFVSGHPLHRCYIDKEESARLLRLMRMNYETMGLFRMNRAERNRCLSVICDYYRLHLPDFPELKSLEILSQLFD